MQAYNVGHCTKQTIVSHNIVYKMTYLFSVSIKFSSSVPANMTVVIGSLTR